MAKRNFPDEPKTPSQEIAEGASPSTVKSKTPYSKESPHWETPTGGPHVGGTERKGTEGPEVGEPGGTRARRGWHGDSTPDNWPT